MIEISPPTVPETESRRLFLEAVFLGAVLCASLLLSVLEGQGIVGGQGWASAGVLLILGLLYRRSFSATLPLYPRGGMGLSLRSLLVIGLCILPAPLVRSDPFALGDWRPGWELRALHLIVLVPIAEEVFFRGLLLDHLRRGWGTVPAVFVCTALFGLLHLQAGSGAAIAAIALSLAACLLVILGGSLAFAVQFHVAWNTYSLLARAPDLASRWVCIVLAGGTIAVIAILLSVGTANDRRRRQVSLQTP